MPRAYNRAGSEMRFRRRRCPACFSGTYSSTVDIPATHRKCSSCGHVFNLKLDGVLPDDVPTRAQVKTPSSSEPIAGGAYAVATKS
jgi:uncharacterized protein (DUF983 family)